MGERIFPVDSPEPLVGDITRGAFSNPQLKEILRAFGKPAFARSAACMEFETFLIRSIGRTDDPDSDFHLLDLVDVGERLRANPRGTCLEIGTYHGITAVVLSQYFERVVCVSVDDDPKKLMKWDIVKHLGITNIEFHDVANNAQKHKLVSGLKFDFAYSDGDHTHDTHTDWALVKHCGRVLFHEVWPIQAPVWNLVNSLPADEVTFADFDCFAYWERKRG